MRETVEFLQKRGLDVERIVPWLREHGGYCDCEVIYNVEEKFGEIVGRRRRRRGEPIARGAMTDPASIGVRFREFRERAGLSHDEVALRVGISPSAVWDFEGCEGDLTSGYSPIEVSKLCRVVGIHPRELFAIETKEAAVSAVELVRLIHEECRSRGITLEQFEDVVGWRLSARIEPPEQLLEDISVDGLQWLCRELGINWHRVILGL